MTANDKYESLKNMVPQLTIGQIRSEFEAFRSLTRAEVAEVAKIRNVEIESKRGMLSRLLDMLEKMRISFEDRRIICG